MPDPSSFTLFSGGAQGAEAFFGRQAEARGVQEVNYTFEGHKIERTRGIRVLTSEELARKDVSLTYVSKLLNRKFSDAHQIRMVLVGTIKEDQTVNGGTGWGAEFAKICNKPLFVFDQDGGVWNKWSQERWEKTEAPMITKPHFTGTGTRFVNKAGETAIADLFARSFS